MLERCGRGDLPVPIALMQLACETSDRAEMEGLIAAALRSHGPATVSHRRLCDVEDLLHSHPQAQEVVRRMEAAERPRQDGVAEADYWAGEYDRAVAISPEASVARYCFGDPVLLRRVTDEVVAGLLEWRVLRPGASVLDYGCGIGRVMAALASHAGHIVGVDISDGMLSEARDRLSGLANATLMSVRDLAPTSRNTGFDLILLVDVLPFVAEPLPLLSELSTRLAPGASLIVMNWSYGLPAEEQRAIAGRFARAADLGLVRNGTAEFTLWDGSVFQFVRASG